MGRARARGPGPVVLLPAALRWTADPVQSEPLRSVRAQSLPTQPGPTPGTHTQRGAAVRTGKRVDPFHARGQRTAPGLVHEALRAPGNRSLVGRARARLAQRPVRSRERHGGPRLATRTALATTGPERLRRRPRARPLLNRQLGRLHPRRPRVFPASAWQDEAAAQCPPPHGVPTNPARSGQSATGARTDRDPQLKVLSAAGQRL